jgi:hypothetical protein
MINRKQFIKTIKSAQVAERADFVSAIALDWLADWPGDLEVQRYLAIAEMELSNYQSAIERAQKLVIQDPEFVEAYETLTRGCRAVGDTIRANIYSACATVLKEGNPDPEHAPSWAITLREALRLLSIGDRNAASAAAQEALNADPNLPLPTLVALKAQIAEGNQTAAYALAQAGHDRWPECIVFRVLLAEDLLAQGKTSRGVSYLHQAVSDDPLGIVTKRTLGADHPYRDLWPTSLTGDLDRPIPAEVAALMGNTMLSGGGGSEKSKPVVDPMPSHNAVKETIEMASEISQVSKDDPETEVSEHSKVTETSEQVPTSLDPKPWEAFQGPDPGDRAPEPEAEEEDIEATLFEVEQEFRRLAERVNARRPRPDEDGRVPAYIVVSSHTQLHQTFGEEHFKRIDEAVMTLVEIVRRRPGWTAYRIYVDDPATLEPFGLTAVDPANAWQIKLRLADLDEALAARAEMIGALLIVGGDNIIPFHKLPNPIDDDDEFVFSDNPYATTDENYFAPEWAVGRLPSNEDPDLLINMLRTAIDDHYITLRPLSIAARLRRWLANRFGRLLRHQQHSLGFSASIWRKASLAVFKAISDPGTMLTSPPTEAERLPSIASRPLRLSYFNLHGLEDAPEWFGQRDPMEDESAGPEFPIAFRPQDVVNSGNAPKIVFTEACYGANTIGKTKETALSLKFLASGTRTVVGSTKISYGSITTPLIAADLLGRLYWEQLAQALPVGEALRRAKLNLAAEMHRRHGFLDGEDQKTLISFVLYGDPLFSPTYIAPRYGQKVIIRRKTRPKHMKTVFASKVADDHAFNLADLARVKSIVSQYLPGMADANCRMYRQQYYGCDGEGHICPTHTQSMQKIARLSKNTTVVTFTKHVEAANRRHPHFARITLDQAGKVLKLAVSR